MQREGGGGGVGSVRVGVSDIHPCYICVYAAVMTQSFSSPSLASRLRATPRSLPAVTYQIPLSGVTILVPIAIPQLIFILRSLSSDQQTALLTYHVIVQRAPWKVLRDAEQGATFATFAGADLIKYGRLNSSLVMLMDKGPLPKPLVIPNLFVNADLVLHAVSEVLVPSDFTGA